MKLHAANNVIEKSGSFQESKFSIEASSKAFFILSDGLYSNKILAVVRELSTNAYDSHVDAGKADIPFDVNLPTAINPTFFIRDYGTSMSHEDCMQLYTTYFRSTRNNSNDAVGCLGLGSKAPFAYTDSFTVESYLDCTKRVYTAYKNEDGSPVFSLLHEADTNEPNGIKVSINVANDDIHRFNREAHKVYEFFKVRPRIVGGQNLQYASKDIVLEGSNWHFDENQGDNLVIMGQIAYPIDASQLNDNPNIQKFVDYSDGLRLFVKIGDVDITPSRESLSYSKETKANLIKIVSELVSEMQQQIEHEIASQPTLFKARIKYVQISDQCSSIKTAVDSLHKSIMWNDTKLFSNIGTESVDINKTDNVVSLDKGSYRKKIESDNNVERIFFARKSKFIVDDLNRGGISRTKQYMRDESGSQSVYLYKLQSGETVDNCRFYDMLGGATKEDVIFTSNLPKIEYTRNSNGRLHSGPAVQAQVFNEETGHFETCNMSVSYDNAYYFEESKGAVKFGYFMSEIDIAFLEKFMNYLHKNYSDELDGINFYLLKPSVIKNRNIESRDNWHNGNKLVTKLLQEAVKKSEQDIVDCRYTYRLSNTNAGKWVNIFSDSTIMDSEVKSIINEHKAHQDRVEKMGDDINTLDIAVRYLDPACREFLNQKHDADRFSKRFDKAMSKYPMLSLTSHIWNENDKKIVIDYINMVNTQAT